MFTHVAFRGTSEIASECYTGSDSGGAWGKTQGDGATQMEDWGLSLNKVLLLIQLFWTYL